MSLFLCLFGISLGRYWQKSLAESGGFRENIKGGLSIEGGGFKASAHYGFL